MTIDVNKPQPVAHTDGRPPRRWSRSVQRRFDFHRAELFPSEASTAPNRMRLSDPAPGIEHMCFQLETLASAREEPHPANPSARSAPSSDPRYNRSEWEVSRITRIPRRRCPPALATSAQYRRERGPAPTFHIRASRSPVGSLRGFEIGLLHELHCGVEVLLATERVTETGVLSGVDDELVLRRVPRVLG